MNQMHKWHVTAFHLCSQFLLKTLITFFGFYNSIIIVKINQYNQYNQLSNIDLSSLSWYNEKISEIAFFS